MAMGRGKMVITEKGFSLLEVLIALTIFSVCSMSITGMFIIGKKAVSNGNLSFTAVQGAKAQMELLRSSVIQNSTSDICSTMSLPSIRCEWSVKRDVPEQGLSSFEVTASWYEGNIARQLVLKTLRFEGNGT